MKNLKSEKNTNEIIMDNRRLSKRITSIKNSKRLRLGSYKRTIKNIIFLPYKVYRLLRGCVLKKSKKYKTKIFNVIKRKINKKIESKINNTSSTEELYALYNASKGYKKFLVGKRLSAKLKGSGELSQNLEILVEINKFKPKVKFIKREINLILDKLDMLNDERYHAGNTNIAYVDYDNIKVKSQIKSLNVVNTSEPYLINGYGIRGKYIFEGLRNGGIEPIICTRPGFPNDYKKDTLEDCVLKKERINRITYYRSNTNVFQRYTPLKEYTNTYARRLVSIAKEENVNIIHAASNYVIGLAGLRCAEKMRRPFVYEIRGLWHITRLVIMPEYKNSEDYMLSERMEIFVAKKANKVITISEALKKWLVKRGVDEGKIVVIPNGVDSEKIVPLKKNHILKGKYVKEEDFIIGYIGSVTKLEGLQNILRTLNILQREGYEDIKLMIVGEGNYCDNLRKLTQELGIHNQVIFAGKIPHHKINDYYSIFDICVFAREDKEVCRIVPPLKIQEAMACGKPIIVSNLEALKETVVHGLNGLIFDNSIEDLYKKIMRLYSNEELREDIGQKARMWIKENRDWNMLINNIKKIYDELLCNE
ncbi:glycosyltransferase family 4 protein [Oceanirhabdus seepicola]|uniref:Glycosyltransferase n=1 Tax=Oceanirhabdus seepicola TaxID=2828781 RepID=A0A9J6P5Y9_9CLOT|nr:glycosyltransferase family 4 protein [Oceanirhabdus seepicola]MCM1991566.1 glycosyltransferase [Oceanirhabdus seepicola]